MVTNSPVGVLRALVILPSRLNVTIVHRLLRQTSTGTLHGSTGTSTEPATAPGSSVIASDLEVDPCQRYDLEGQDGWRPI